MLLALPQCLFGLLAFGDVIVGLQDRHGTAPCIPLQRPPARHDGPRAVLPRVDEFPVPAACTGQLGRDLFERPGEDRPHELVRDLADSFVLFPPVQLLSAAVPKGDNVVHVAHEDRIVGEIEQSGLLAQHHFSRSALHSEDSRNADRRKAKKTVRKGDVGRCIVLRQQIA